MAFGASYRSDPARAAAAVTPSDTVNLAKGTTVALFIGGAGNISVQMNGETVVFTGVVAGTVLPIQCTRVNATSTTATNITAMF